MDSFLVDQPFSVSHSVVDDARTYDDLVHLVDDGPVTGGGDQFSMFVQAESQTFNGQIMMTWCWYIFPLFLLI